MPFNQVFNAPVMAQYNIDGVSGDVNLTAQSGAEELGRQLATIRDALARSSLAEEVKTAAVAQISAAEAAGQAPKPSGIQIKAHLDSAAQTIESAAGVATKVGTLAKTLFGIGTWAAAILT